MDGSGSGDGDDASSTCLDEHGWDPYVDSFLRNLVRQAPHTDFGVVDFVWVSSRFLETLEPDESQMVSALQRFNPSALEERWLFLQQFPEDELVPDGFVEDEFGDEEEEEEEHEGYGAAAASDGRLPLLAGGGERPTGSCSSSFLRGEEGGTAGATAAEEAQESEAGRSEANEEGEEQPARPQRRRVLDAMQSFLFGRAVPRPTGDEILAASPAVHFPIAGAAVAPGVAAQEEGPDLGSDGELEAASAALELNLSSPPEAVLGAGGGEGRVNGSGNEALRRCLDELRWHGEALRRCATGEDATALCAEAAGRRKTLLWSLGVGPEPSA